MLLSKAMLIPRTEPCRRSLRLARHPRALSDAERAEIRANLEPVLRDMRNSGAIVPDVRVEAHDDFGPEYVHAWIEQLDHRGQAPPFVRDKHDDRRRGEVHGQGAA